MKLYHARTSPFVRKVLVCAHLLDLAGRIELIGAAAHPVNPDKTITPRNPLGQVPTLVPADGPPIHDSRVICEYLADLADDGTLFPPSGQQRWQALTLQSMADGLLNAALAARYETTVRPPEKQWDDWSDALLAKALRVLDHVDPATLATNQPTIGEITLACALGYLDFRFPDLDWRATRPSLADWYTGFAAQPAMQDTQPFD